MMKANRWLIFGACLCVNTAVWGADAFVLEGKWQTTTTLPGENEVEGPVVLTKKDGVYSGVAETSAGEKVLKKVVFENGEVGMALDVDYQGAMLEFIVVAKPEGADTLEGEWKAQSADGETLASGDWSAKREAAPSHPVAGEWKATAKAPDDVVLALDVEITETDGKLAAEMKTKDGSLPVESAAWNEGTLTMKILFPYDGSAVPVTITVDLKDDQLVGKWVAKNPEDESEVSGAWTAVRADAPSLEGAWDVKAALADGSENVSVFHFQPDKDSGWKGKAVSDNGELEFEKVAVDTDGVVIDLKLSSDGNDVEIRIKAAPAKDWASMEGEWIAFDSSGQEAARGAWKAARKTDS